MRPRILLTALFTLIVFSSFCQVPQTLSYQGLLTDNAGVPLTDGSYAVTFRFYAAATGGVAITSRGPLTINTFKGLFTTTLGDGTTDNAALPFSLADQEVFIGITISPSTTELSPRIKITAIPYAFVANTVKSVDAALINSGTLPIARIGDGTINSAKISDGTITSAKINDGTIATVDIADGAITNAKLAANSLDASKFTAGTLPIARIADGAVTSLKINDGSIATIDIADGAITSVKIGDGTIATVDITDGAITNAKLANGLDAGKFTSGTLPASVLDANLQDLADGVLSDVSISLTGTNASKLAAGTSAQRPGSPVEGQIRYNSTEKVMEYYNGTNWYFMVPKVAFLKDLKTSGTDGGTFTSGSFITRDLNTIEGDVSFVSLSANRFTLSAGEYIIEASAPAYRVAMNRIILKNINDDTNDIIGSSEYSRIDLSAEGTNRSHLLGKISIGSSKQFEIQHRCFSTLANFGLGNRTGFGLPEVFTQVKITKLR